MKSEIIIIICKNEENIGQIDIHSQIVNLFLKKNQKLLEFVCEQVYQII